MNYHTLQQPQRIIGMAFRTSNDTADQDIPAYWQQVMGGQKLDGIRGRLDDAVYAVYTEFSHPGVDNVGPYTYVIGVAVSDDAPVPDGLQAFTLPAARYAVFDVPSGRPEHVGERWRDIWNWNDARKAYRCDFERYRQQADGRCDIAIHVGLH
ncbi:GyrI-like domain-containing protein [Leeia sp.]|uniref:GyrI-like domain-containing protein n=1 Tax=Leeia sp. TaxID=2884678 RepID=UPI0035B08DEA